MNTFNEGAAKAIVGYLESIGDTSYSNGNFIVDDDFVGKSFDSGVGLMFLRPDDDIEADVVRTSIYWVCEMTDGTASVVNTIRAEPLLEYMKSTGIEYNEFMLHVTESVRLYEEIERQFRESMGRVFP